VPQAVAQPLHARAARAQRQWRGAAARRSPQQHVVAEPAAREVADADFALRAAEVDLRMLGIEACEHQLVGESLVVDDVQHRRPVEQPQLRERAALRQAFQPGAQRLRARILAARHVRDAPEREQFAECLVRIRLRGIPRQQLGEIRRRGGFRFGCGRGGHRRRRGRGLHEKARHEQRDTGDGDGGHRGAGGPGHPHRMKIPAEHFAGRAAHHAGAHHVAVFGEGAQQRAVADDVHQPRHAA
jgi:hypothetical protein